MKIAAYTIGLNLSFALALAAGTPKPFKTIELGKAKIAGSTCQIELPDGLSSVVWLDEQHLMASSFAARCPSSSTPTSAESEVVVFDIAGSILKTDRQGAVTLFLKGPRGTIAALQTGKIDLLDAELHLQQTIQCPKNSGSCGISHRPSSTLNSNFEVCTTVDQQHQLCDVYSGWPAIKIGQIESQSEDPPSGIWPVGPEETWFFDHGLLKSSGAGRVQSLVSPEDFVGKEGGSCDGHLSEVEPRRFLAVCIGTHWYSDGMFDAIFSFSRVVLFDTSTKSVVKRIDGPSYISAALSPAGKRVAILKSGRVRLYQAD